ncbi:hypothetical protein ACFYNV_17905 [Streptomyces albidoflavus]
MDALHAGGRSPWNPPLSSTLAQPWNPAVHSQSGEVVDHGSPAVRRLAATLGADRPPVHECAEAAFTYVRDRIAHSDDTGDPRVTWRASEVLTLATGLCHAEAHPLCALLRADGTGVHATARPRVLAALRAARDRTEPGGLLPAGLADPR